MSSSMSRKEGMVWYSSSPCLLSDKHYSFLFAIAVTDWFSLRVKCGRWWEGPWILNLYGFFLHDLYEYIQYITMEDELRDLW